MKMKASMMKLSPFFTEKAFVDLTQLIGKKSNDSDNVVVIDDDEDFQC